VGKPLAMAGQDWIAELRRRGVTLAFISHCEIVLRHLKTFAGPDTLASDITSETIRKFLSSKNWTATTQNTVRSRLVGFFSFCIADGCCAIHPIKDKRVLPVNEEKKAPTIFTVEECERLLGTAQEHMPHMIPYLVLGLFCGIRPGNDGEMSKLKPENIKLDRGLVEIPAAVSKTRDRRLVELSANALEWLRAAPSLEVVGDRYWRRKLADKAGVEWHQDAMRHSFCSYHVEKHGSADKTALQLGHQGSTKMLHAHYKATVDHADAERFWAITPKSIVKILPEPVKNAA
jgi:hypothetical protein